MPWQVIMLLQNFLAAFYALVSRNIGRKYKDAHFQITAVVFTCLYILGLAYVMIFNRHITTHMPVRFWLLFISGGIGFALSNIASQKVYQYVDASIASLMSTLNIIMAVITATLVISEGLSAHQIVGALLLLGSIWWILSIKVTIQEHRELIKGLGLSLIAALFFGLAITNEKYLLNHVNLPSYLAFGWGFQWLAVLSCGLVFNRSKFGLFKDRKLVKQVGLAGVIRAGGGFTFI